MLKFFVFFSILLLGNLYIVWRMASHAPHTDAARTVWITGLIFFLLQLSAFYVSTIILAYFQQQGELWFLLGRIFSFVTFTAMGIAFAMVVYVVFADLLELMSRWVLPPMSVATMKNTYFYGVLVVTVVTTAIGLYQAQAGLRVEYVTITSDKVPDAFNGYKIVHITDLHVGPVIRKSYVARVAAMIKSENPDVIVNTGDNTDGNVKSLADDLIPLKELSPPDGIYFAEGNHEHYRDHKNWLSLYEKWGWHVLRNSHGVIHRGADQLVIAGVYDYGTAHLESPHASDPYTAIKGAPEDAYKILLAHQPIDYQRTKDAGFDLLLSGHTHGGQFFPWTLFVGFAHTYSEGFYRHQDALDIFVNRGVGYWGPPLRTFSPPILTVITLQKK